MKTAVLTIFLALIVAAPLSITSYGWDSFSNLVAPEDVAERPPEVPFSEDFDNDTFTRENFYDRSSGTRQYRQNIRTPQKNMSFEVYKPENDTYEVYEPPQEEPKPAAKEPSTEAGIVNKDGKAVTVISIKKDPKSDSETK